MSFIDVVVDPSVPFLINEWKMAQKDQLTPKNIKSKLKQYFLQNI